MRVAIIGGGIGGLYSIKACLEEGLEPHCFEKTDQIGGTWVYREQYKEGDPAGVYQGLCSNTSVYNHEASDFPSHITTTIPTWEEQLEYTQKFARHFDLEKYIKFNTEVIKVEQVSEGNWSIITKENGQEKTDEFDAVLVCTGRFHKPIVPEIAGREKFRGQFMTANQYKHSKQDEVLNKRVLIVGNAYTAADISALTADTARQVYLSIGRGCSYASATSDDGVPLDTLAINRGTIYTMGMVLPLFFMIKFKKMMTAAYNKFPDQEKYGITLNGSEMLTRPILYTGQDLTSKVREGKVKVKPLLTELTEHRAEFSDGTSEEIDTIIVATGYDISYPFLSKDLIADTVSELELYKLMWPLTTQKPNLAVIGCIKIIGVFPPFIELQTRWALQVFTKKCQLPPKEEMKKEIETRQAILKLVFGKSVTQTEMPVLLYQDFMAEQIGALPRWWHYMFTNPLLAHILRTGPAFPSTYRLVGPHSCDKAAERTIELYNRWCQKRRSSPYGHILMASTVAAFTGFLVYKLIQNIQ